MASDDSDGTRERLLRAAVEELDEHGHADISLRAVARRAGVSHAAPKHHFASRADLLTATAARGFRDLAAALDQVVDDDAADRLAALGRVYVDFGLSRAAVFDLMFRPEHLVVDDPALREAQVASVQALAAAAADLAGAADLPAETLTLMAWGLVHGLVALARDGALRHPLAPAQEPPGGTAAVVVEAFAGLVGRRAG